MRHITRLAVLFMVAFVAIGAATGAVTATEHTTTLAGDGTDEVIDFEASEDEYLEHTVEADGADFGEDGTETVYLNVTTDDGDTEHEMVSADVDAADVDHTFNISHADLQTVDGDAGSTQIVDVTTWGEDADGTETTLENTFEVDLVFDSHYAAATVDDSAADVEETETGGIFGFGAEETTIVTFDETVGIAGNGTTVMLNDDTSDGADAFDDATETDREDNLVLGAAAAADGSPILAFDGEADEDLVDDGDTYAVYQGDGTWVLHVGEDHDSAEEIDVFASSQNAFSAEFDSDEIADAIVEPADLSYSDLRDGGVDRIDIILGLGVLPFFGGMVAPLAAGLAFAGHRGRVAA